MSIGIFMLHKNESLWIGAWLEAFLPWVDQFAIYDGDSTDGSLEVIEHFAKLAPGKVKLFKHRDPKDLRDDYVRLFDECLHALDTDLAFFAHPDQIPENPEAIAKAAKSDAIAMSCRVDSYAGEPGGQLYRIDEGRCSAWKSIYRLRNPDLGAHYHGWYGAANEDVYFSAITGNQHQHHGANFAAYPYAVEDSGIRLMHFSDVRPYERRLGRMKTCLVHQGLTPEVADHLARLHPRVTLKDGAFGPTNFRFTNCEYPPAFKAAQEKWSKYAKEEVEARKRVDAGSAANIRQPGLSEGKGLHPVMSGGDGKEAHEAVEVETEPNKTKGHPGGY